MDSLSSPIGRRLLGYILLVSSAITLVLSAWQLWREYQQDLAHIDQTLTQIEVTSLPALTEQVWTVNKAAVQLQLNGLAKMPDIERLAVIDQNGQLIADAGQESQSSTFDRVYPLRYRYAGDWVALGQLQVAVDMQVVYARLWDTALTILASQGLKTFLVSVFILFIVHRLVTRNLQRLAAFVRNFNLQDGDCQAPEFNSDDEIGHLCSALRFMREDLSKSFARQKSLEQRFRKIFDGSNDAIFVLDIERGVIQDCNLGAVEMLGYPLIELRGMAMSRIHPDEMREVHRLMTDVQRDGRGWSTDLSCVRADNTRIPAEVSASLIEIDGSVRMLAMVRDVSARKAAEDRAAYLAYHDSLTDLPNRGLLMDRLSISLARARRYGHRGSVLVLDVDHFKTINDSLGHKAGDRLLQQVAGRLQSQLRENDTFARLSADEFVVVFDGVDNDVLQTQREAELLANKLRHALNDPFNLEGHPVHVSLSIGVALYPDHGDTADKVLRRADSAMHQAKSDGRDRLSVFAPHLEEGASRRLELQAKLRDALRRNEYVLDIQPQVSLKNGEVVGAEALLRWREPGSGLVPPDQFIPFLEESGLIVPVGRWVLRTACQHWKKQLEAGHYPADARIAVNVSPREMQGEGYCKDVAEALRDADLPAANLELELTEQMVVDNHEAVVEKLNTLRDMGVSLAIDDFGTGYSSLAYLQRLPVHTVKIDRSFVARMDESVNDAALVDTIVTMGHKLDLRVVAEGVETDAQRRRLIKYGCDIGQGYFFGRPVTMVDFSRPESGVLQNTHAC